MSHISVKFIFDGNENTKAGNKKFSEKINHYKEYNNLKIDKTLFFTRKINDEKSEEFNLLEKKSWTTSDVNHRDQHIISNLLKIWK